MNGKEIGILGEKIALDYLQGKGYKILDKNFKVGFLAGPQTGEIDIVCKKDDVINFVEVKTSFTNRENVFFPEDRVDLIKRKKIAKAAECWLIQNKIALDNPWQIDIIAIELDDNQKQQEISFFENADAYQ
ncbi:MAG: hypothetical protein UR98_C0002G0025 [Parcubacteria group bacterium GW2011_GWA1_36_12]|nr:MAG: hypothetical protein UR98_C0002G0025 [Parcubacteria group bacterium GW2011_GWA1_36_12]